MAMPLVPLTYDKKRLTRRPRTANHTLEDAVGMALGASAATTGGHAGAAATMGADRKSGVVGGGCLLAASTAAWGADDGNGSDTDLEDEDMCVTGRGSHVKTTRAIYSAACRRYGALPSSQVLANITTETLNLTNRNLGAKDATALACALLNNTDVTSFLLSGNRIGPDGIRSVCEMMGENVYITLLDVSNNKLTKEGAGDLGSMLRINEELRVLKVNGNKFQEKGAAYLAESLQHNFRLNELDLSDNSLQDEGGAAFGQALTHTDTLLKLNLSWNHLRMKGAVSIATGLQNNASLTHLNLSWNGFSDEGARALCAALKENVTLVDLDLTSNRITAIGAASIGEAITFNNTLQALRLAKNPLSSIGAVKVLEALRKNESSAIKILDMKEVAVTSDFEALVSEIGKSRAGINIERGMVVSTHDHMATLLTSSPTEISFSEPIHLFMAHVKLKKMQLWDYFIQFDEELTLKVRRTHFIQSCQASRLPMSPKQLDDIVQCLDPKNTDCIDYGQLLNCQGDPILRAKTQIARGRLKGYCGGGQEDSTTSNTAIRPLTSVESQSQEGKLSRPTSPVRPSTSHVGAIPADDEEDVDEVGLLNEHNISYYG